MDILSKLIPSLNLDDEREPTEEELDQQDAEAKAERIRFHREKVRNGPVNFKGITNGQFRRAQKRDLARQVKQTRRQQVRNYLETQRLAAMVRGHLQRAGVLPYLGDVEIDPVLQVSSTAWIVQRFGVNVEVDGEETNEVSYAYQDVLVALEAAVKFYSEAVHNPKLRVPVDYVVPIYEQGTEPAGVRA